jgi:predicted transcriptional regulator
MDMLCEEVMTTDVEYATLRETIESVATRMRDANIGFLPVCDDEGHVMGTVCERDIIVGLVANDMSARSPAGAVMTRELIACRPKDDVRSAARRMRDTRAAQILCVDDAGMLAGVISQSDIARVEAVTS